MPDPFDYTLKGVQNPADSFMQGLQLAQQMRANTAQREQMEMAKRQAEAAAQRQAYLQEKMAGVAQKPSAAGVRNLMIEFPEYANQYKEALSSLSDEEKLSVGEQAAAIGTALIAGKKDTALNLININMEAAKNSGKMDRANTLKSWKEMLESEETGATGDNIVSTLSMSIASAALPKDVMENWIKAQEQPSKTRKSIADATIQEAKAGVAQSEAELELEKKGWDVKKIQSDIDVSKQNSKIAAMNAALARESNDLKREELRLKIQDTAMARGEKMRDRAFEAESAVADIDSADSLVTELLSDKNAGARYAATGSTAFSGKIPGSQARTYAGKVEQLTNALALPNLGKLKGAMSDKDIMFIKNVSANLDRYQSTAAFEAELKKVGRILSEAKERVRSKYGMPESSGGVEPTPTSGTPRNVTVDY